MVKIKLDLGREQAQTQAKLRDLALPGIQFFWSWMPGVYTEVGIDMADRSEMGAQEAQELVSLLCPTSSHPHLGPCLCSLGSSDMLLLFANKSPRTAWDPFSLSPMSSTNLSGHFLRWRHRYFL